MNAVSSLCCVNEEALKRQLAMLELMVSCRTTDTVLAAADQCRELSDTTATACSKAVQASGSLLSLSDDCTNQLRGFGDGSTRGMQDGPAVFSKIQRLTEGTQLGQSIDVCTEMNSLGQEILKEANEMNQSVTTAIDELPESLKEEERKADEEGDTVQGQRTRAIGDDTEEEQVVIRKDDFDEGQAEELLKLMDVDEAVADLENSCSQSRDGALNLFSAASFGSKVFEQTNSKGLQCQELFGQMKQLCAALKASAQALIMNESGCCTRVRAVVSGIASLFRCQRLAQLLGQVAKVCLRLVAAIKDLVSVAWKKIKGFMSEFDAAKKLGRFLSGVKDSKVGKFASGLVSSLLSSG